MPSSSAYIGRGTLAARPAAGTAGRLYYVTDDSTLYRDSGSAWESVGEAGAADPLTTKGDVHVYGASSTRLPVGTDGHVLTVDSAQALGVKWAAAAGGGATIDGLAPWVEVEGIEFNAAAAYTGAADEARAFVFKIAAPMRIRSLAIDVGTAGSGTHEWGLFNCKADALACVKVAGGSGALGTTGWQTIAATGAPVAINAGTYIMIFKWPAANMAALRWNHTNPQTGGKSSKRKTSYVWDDTPDVVTSWTDDGAVFHFMLRGDIDEAGNQW